MSEFVKELDEKGFKELIAGDKPVMVDFWAVWCGPCKALAPYIDQLAAEFQGKAFFGKVNIDDNMKLAEEYEVSSIPTIMIFKGGKMLERSIGMRPKAGLAQMLEKHL